MAVIAAAAAAIGWSVAAIAGSAAANPVVGAMVDLASVTPSVTAATAVSPAPAAPSAAPSAIRFTLIATVPGRTGAYSPWSPTAPLIAYSDEGGIAVLDATQAPPTPIRVLPGIDADCTWSPDGAWLVARAPSRTPAAQGAALIAVPARGGGEVVVADDILVSDFTWAADGKIYWWDYESPRPHAVEPPAEWRRSVKTPLAGRPVLVFAFGAGAPAAHRFDVRDGAVKFNVLRALAGLPRSIVHADGFTDGRLLVRVSGAMDDGPGVNHIFDAAGEPAGAIPATLEGDTFAALSVAPDGSFVAGERVDDAGDGILASTLHFVAVDGAWTAPVQGVEWGVQPHLSRVGTYLAFADADGRTHIGSWTRAR